MSVGGVGGLGGSSGILQQGLQSFQELAGLSLEVTEKTKRSQIESQGANNLVSATARPGQ